MLYFIICAPFSCLNNQEKYKKIFIIATQLSSFIFKRFHIASALLYKNKNTLSFSPFHYKFHFGSQENSSVDHHSLSMHKALGSMSAMQNIKNRKSKVYLWQIYSHTSGYILSLNLLNICILITVFFHLTFQQLATLIRFHFQCKLAVNFSLGFYKRLANSISFLMMKILSTG